MAKKLPKNKVQALNSIRDIGPVLFKDFIAVFSDGMAVDLAMEGFIAYVGGKHLEITEHGKELVRFGSCIIDDTYWFVEKKSRESSYPLILK